MTRAHSCGRPKSSPLESKMKIYFASITSKNIPVKSLMKTIHQKNHIIPELFQIAAQIENPMTTPSGKTPSVVTEKEFAVLRKEALKSMTSESIKLKPTMPMTEAYGWSYPFPIRK